MKITGVTTSVASSRLPSDSGVYSSSCTLIQLHSSAQITGTYLGHGDLEAYIRLLVDRVLIGEEPSGAVGLWARMCTAVRESGDSAELNAAAAALDVALWDMKARAAGQPLWRMLGGERPRARAHATLGELDSQELTRQGRRLAEQFGVHAVSLAMSADHDADLERLELLRGVLRSGPDEPVIAMSLGGRLTSEQAIAVIRHYETRVDLTWIDDVDDGGNAAALSRLSQNIRAAVCVGSEFTSTAQFLPYFRSHAPDVVGISLAMAGITGALQVADCAFGYELPVILRAAPGGAHVHVAAAMPYLMSVEVGPLCAQAQQGPLIRSDVRVAGGWAVAGDLPGHGWQLESSAFAEGAIT